MKNKLNYISESEKNRILEMHIKALLKEQGTPLNVGGSFQQGQAKTIGGGQQAGKALKQQISNALKTAKEISVKIGNTIIKFLIYGTAVICFIGLVTYKITKAIFDALIKFLTATGNVVIGAATAVAETTVDILTTAIRKTGQGIQNASQAIGTFVRDSADKSYGIIIYCLKACKQFGIMIWGKILVMASTISEFGQTVWNWCKQQYQTIANQLGMAWDSAVDMAKQGWESLKNLGSKALDYGKKAANTAADYAGQAWGAAKGFAQGLFNESIQFYHTYYSIESTDTLSLIRECSKITKNVII